MRKKPKNKQLLTWFDGLSISAILKIFVFVVTVITSAQLVTHWGIGYYHSTLAWKSAEQQKINKLSPTETLAYFNSILGQPILESKPYGMTDYTKYIYKERGYWVAAYSDSANIVEIVGITACGEHNFYPVITNVPTKNPITLSKSYMSDGVDGGGSVLGSGNYYFLQGASEPSYYYDVSYEAHPGRYQTVGTGNNQFCGGVIMPKDIAAALDKQRFGTNNLSTAQIINLRRHVLINTIIITAPHIDFTAPQTPIHLPDLADVTVSYEDAGILTAPSRLSTEQVKNNESIYESAQPFQVVKALTND